VLALRDYSGCYCGKHYSERIRTFSNSFGDCLCDNKKS